MKIFRNMALALLAAAYAAGCEKTPELVSGTMPGDGKRIAMTFHLVPRDMQDALSEGEPGATAATPATSATRASANEALTVRMGTAAGTRADGSLEPTEEEKRFTGLWVLQFDGAGDKASCLASDYYDATNIVDNQLDATVVGTTWETDIYFVANVGSTYFTDNTVATLSDFKALLYGTGLATAVPGDGFPMVGLFRGTLGLEPATITMDRMYARVDFTCEVATERFSPYSVRIVNHATQESFVAPEVPTGTTGLTPDASVAANFATDAAEAVTMNGSAFTKTWYVPENLRGVVAGLTEAEKHQEHAPERSTSLEVTGLYDLGSDKVHVTYSFYLGRNTTDDFNVIRNHIYTYAMTIQGIDLDDPRMRVEPVENLSAGGTANCYLVHDAGQLYEFDATVMGNGAYTEAFVVDDVVQFELPAIDGTVPLQPATARLLWETGDVAGSVIVENSVECTDGKVRFMTAGAPGDQVVEGNAVIGVFDSNGTLIWSWHIWSTQYDPEVDHVYYSTHSENYPPNGEYDYTPIPNKYCAMQHHLGANTTAQLTDKACFGLLYQWGRKDPFVGYDGLGVTSLSYSQTPTSNTEGYAWSFSEKTSSDADVAADPVAYAIQHPTTFITDPTDSGSWTGDVICGNFWGNPYVNETPFEETVGSKSIYDPCPPGWRVPPYNVFKAFWNGEAGDAYDQENRNAVNPSASFITDKCYYFYTSTVPWRSGITTCYPWVASRTYNGKMYRSNIVWQSSFSFYSDANPNNYESDVFSIDYRGSYSYGVAPVPAAGGNVRCVREEIALGGNPTPEQPEAENLSASANANCYMVHKGGKRYKFNASIMGNGVPTPAFGSYSSKTPSTLWPDDAVLLWETGTKGNVIAEGSVEYKDGYVYFTTGGTAGGYPNEGNAVIAVRDASDKILWSWHIWATKYDPEQDFEVITNPDGMQFDIMQYNLGADCSAGIAAAPQVYGLHYQWGRKDPFIGAGAATSTTQAETSNTAGYEWDFGTTYYAGSSPVQPDPIGFAIQHPTVCISSGFSYRMHWIADDDLREASISFWGSPKSGEIGTKTFYDPCPPGWRVPPREVFTTFLKTEGYSTTQSDWNVKNPTSIMSDLGFYCYTSFVDWGTGSTVFFPLAGSRYSGIVGDPSFTLSPSELSVKRGGYWSSTILNLTQASISGLYMSTVDSEQFYLSNVGPDQIGPDTYGMACPAHCYSVRCVRE